jgi:XTP/dITP diphosphohydrolase
MKIVLASTNPGKLREFQQILYDQPLELMLPQQLGLQLEVAETGSTYAENAALKARAYAAAANLLALADDSGLEVAALGGAPGLYSARYAPQPGADDAVRRAYLLQNLQAQPRPWPARFVCAIALARPDGQTRFSFGECLGEIIPQQRGDGGFGYDPIFWLPELGCTMAELPAAQKNQLSHRARAARAAIPLLLDWGI